MKAETEKRTTRTGKRIGMKDRPTISVKVNDPDRVLSRMWELVKRHSSRRKETAAETAKRVFLKGLTAELEEIYLLRDVQTETNTSQLNLW